MGLDVTLRKKTISEKKLATMEQFCENAHLSAAETEVRTERAR